MQPDNKPLERKDRSNTLGWVMFFRVVFTTIMLGTTIIVQLRQGYGQAYSAPSGLYLLIIAIYLLTVAYALVLPRFFSVTIQAYIQSIFDVFISSAIIYLTGGIESIFSFMYILSIINSSFVLYRSGALVVASVSIICYGLMLDFEYYQYINPYPSHVAISTSYSAPDIIYRILINMFAFYLAGYLSGYLALRAEETRRKLLAKETDLKRLEDLNESIIDSIETGILTLDPDGRILSCNPAGESISGYRIDQIRGLDYYKIFSKLKLPPMNQPTWAMDAWSYDHTRPDGQTLHLEMTLQALKDPSGANWGRLLVFQDKTRIQQMEEEVKRVELLATIGEMAAGIAHEIRTPLASMSGSFQMLEQELSTQAGYAPYTRIIKREMDRLEYLVQDFLLFARPNKGNPESIDLNQKLPEIIKSFKAQTAAGENIEIKLEVTEKVCIEFDLFQFEQVIWNLLKNGVDALEGEGELTISLAPQEDDEKMTALEVSDTGKGIPKQDILKIFEPFFTTKETGNGLGLSIVMRIVENAGGRIKVFSQPKIGTTFTVLLPLARQRG